MPIPLTVCYSSVNATLLVNSVSKCYRGDVTVKRDSRMDSTQLESEGDTEEDDETDGTLMLHVLHTCSRSRSLTHGF